MILEGFTMNTILITISISVLVLGYYHYYKQKKRQQTIYLSDIVEEIHQLVSQMIIMQGQQLLLMRLSNYLCRSITCPYRDVYIEIYEIAKVAPWIFDKLYAYESSKRKPYFWERETIDFPTKFEILKRADSLFPTHKEIRKT